MSKIGQNPKSIFLQYDVLFRTPSLLFRAYLVHFVRQFLCFQTKLLVLVVKGYLTKFSQCSNAINTKIIQMCLGLRPFSMCMALATAFAHKYQCF